MSNPESETFSDEEIEVEVRRLEVIDAALGAKRSADIVTVVCLIVGVIGFSGGVVDAVLSGGNGVVRSLALGAAVLAAGLAGAAIFQGISAVAKYLLYRTANDAATGD